MIILLKARAESYNLPRLVIRGLASLAGPGHFWEAASLRGVQARSGSVLLMASGDADKNLYHLLMQGMPEIRALRELLTTHGYAYVNSWPLGAYIPPVLQECPFWDGEVQQRLTALMWELSREHLERSQSFPGEDAAEAAHRSLVEACRLRCEQLLQPENGRPPLVVPTEDEVAGFLATAIHGYFCVLADSSGRSSDSHNVAAPTE